MATSMPEATAQRCEKETVKQRDREASCEEPEAALRSSGRQVFTNLAAPVLRQATANSRSRLRVFLMPNRYPPYALF